MEIEDIENDSMRDNQPVGFKNTKKSTT